MLKKLLAVMLTLILFASTMLNSTVVSAYEYSDNDTNEQTKLSENEDALEEISADGYSTGAVFSNEKALPDVEVFGDASKVSLPTKKDLSADIYFPPIGNQGSVGSCVAWSTTYYQFGYAVAKLNGWNAKSDSHKRFSPKWTYNLLNCGQDDGITSNSAYKLLSVQGAVRYDEFTPTGQATNSEILSWDTNTSHMKEALRYRVSQYNYTTFASTSINTPITSNTSSCLNNLKNLLNSEKVISFVTHMNNWYLGTLSSQYSSSLNGQKVCIKQLDVSHSPDTDDLGVHQLTIVGYDDNVYFDLDNDHSTDNFEKGAFKIANSWDTDWENGGYIWVMYDAFNKLSNVPGLNASNRNPVMLDYRFSTIVVDEYPLDLIAEVKMKHRARNEIYVRLNNVNNYDSSKETMFYFQLGENGGPYNFSGNQGTYLTKTFVFDFGDKFDLSNTRRNYYLFFYDIQTNNTTDYDLTLSEIKLKDSTNTTVVTDSSSLTFHCSTKTRSYRLGRLGDVDNNGQVNMSDITLIQNYLAGLAMFSNDQLKSADTDKNGNITLLDVTNLQEYISHISDYLPGGNIVYLG